MVVTTTEVKLVFLFSLSYFPHHRRLCKGVFAKLSDTPHRVSFQLSMHVSESGQSRTLLLARCILSGLLGSTEKSAVFQRFETFLCRTKLLLENCHASKQLLRAFSKFRHFSKGMFGSFRTCYQVDCFSPGAMHSCVIL